MPIDITRLQTDLSRAHVRWRAAETLVSRLSADQQLDLKRPWEPEVRSHISVNVEVR